MLLNVSPAQGRAILSAMRAVATENAQVPMSSVDSHTLAGAARFIFKMEVAEDLAPISPERLASVLPSASDRLVACRFLAVMSLVDGQIDPKRVEVANTFAESLGKPDSGIEMLVQSAQGHLHDVLACMMRQNILSITGKQWLTDDFMSFFLPYTGTPEDQVLEAKFESLQQLPEGTLGREFWHWYKSNNFAFPGNPKGLNQAFGMPHDTTHLLSGYDTSPHGELLVSTFTAGMHPDEPMEGHILPVIYSWHLNIRINDVATSSAGQFDPDHFWEAWERGSETKADVFDPSWDFWANVRRDLADLRAEYRIPPKADERTLVG